MNIGFANTGEKIAEVQGSMKLGYVQIDIGNPIVMLFALDVEFEGRMLAQDSETGLKQYGPNYKLNVRTLEKMKDGCYSIFGDDCGLCQNEDYRGFLAMIKAPGCVLHAEFNLTRVFQNGTDATDSYDMHYNNFERYNRIVLKANGEVVHIIKFFTANAQVHLLYGIDNELVFSYGTIESFQKAKAKLQTTFEWVNFLFNVEYAKTKDNWNVLVDEKYWRPVVERVLHLEIFSDELTVQHFNLWPTLNISRLDIGDKYWEFFADLLRGLYNCGINETRNDCASMSSFLNYMRFHMRILAGYLDSKMEQAGDMFTIVRQELDTLASDETGEAVDKWLVDNDIFGTTN